MSRLKIRYVIHDRDGIGRKRQGCVSALEVALEAVGA